MMNAAIETAERKLAAIDKRIDIVRAEMWRVAGLDVDGFDYETQDGQMAACRAFTVARRDFNSYDGIERSLYFRRYDARTALDKLIAKQAKADERAEARAYRKATAFKTCPTCGQIGA